MPLIFSISPLAPPACRKLAAAFDADLVVVHDAERIIRHFHVQPGEVSPGAADGVERPALPALQQLGARQFLARDPGGLGQRVLRHVLQAQAAERQGDAVADRSRR